MTHRDDEQSAPHPHQAMIGSPPSEDALVSQSNGMPPTPIYAGSPMPPAHDVLRGAMDLNGFLNCLRRRWLVAICVGFVAGIVAAGTLWVSFPEASSAMALFQVSGRQPTIVFDEAHRNESQEFAVLQRTQLAWLKSPILLQAALGQPGIVGLSLLAGESDQLQWLTDELDVSFLQNSEVLSISLSVDGDPEELRTMVNAVANAYKNQVIDREGQQRQILRDALAKSLLRINREISDKMESRKALAEDLNVTLAYQKQDPESQIMIREVSEAAKSKGLLEGQLAELTANFYVMRQQLKDPAMIDAMVDEQLANDPQMSSLNSQLMHYQYQLSSQSAAMKSARSREADRLQRQIAKIQQEITQLRAQMKQQMAGARKGQPNPQLQAITKEYQIRASLLQRQIQQLDTSINTLTEELMKKSEIPVELEIKTAELAQLQEIGNDMSIRLESLDVESFAPKRIAQIQPATITPGIGAMTRYAITGFGGLAAFALACFGIAWVEFRDRRLNGPSQVDEGLGIRVIGTLPALSAHKTLDPNHPIVAQLTESVDSIRTQLMHDSTSKHRQIVMITSALELEGRTTVASQLAASLARAGRRTLLVDGDIRRPALHALFDVSLEDGLCEVLRAEVDVADVIRPTHAEGLWLLTAGYCDVDAIHALATEQMQPVFEKLRSEYDFIVIDGAPVVGMSDALIFGQYCDGAILSVRRDHSQMPKISEAAATLRSVGIRLIGAVVNGVSAKPDDRITQLRLIEPKSERQLQPA